MARITVEDCIDKFPSRFELVLVASQRARKLHSGEESLVEKDNDKNTVIALREIADSAFTVEEIKENLIQEYQTVTISDEEEENLETNNELQENLDTTSKEEADPNKENEELLNSNNEAEEEMNSLIKAEDKELDQQFEIDEKIISENTDQQTESDSSE